MAAPGHPIRRPRSGLALTGADSADALAELMAAVGLAQNFAAIRALATHGIQAGHMRLHARSLAAAAGASDATVDDVAERLVASGEIKDWKARDIVAEMQPEALPANAATAAGKIILFGEHAVVYGKHALAIPIPNAVRATATETSEPTNLRVREWHFETTVDAEADPIAAVVSTILSELQCADRHFRIEVSSRLPRAKGLGSSAAIAVAVTRAIAAAIEMPVSDERVNEIAFRCETIMHGTPSGVDNTISCFARPLLFQRGTELQTEIVAAPDLPLVVAVAHGAGATDRMVAGVRERREAMPAFYERAFESIDALTLAGRDALGRGDHIALGAMMDHCQGLLNAIGVSTAELETMLEIARQNRALGAKLTGAGGGGAVIALCPGRQDQVRSALRAAGFSTLDLEDPDDG